MATLFDSLHIGELLVPNRIVMAPLTRSRAGGERIPNALMAEYYAQRAEAGLIITEGTVVSPMAAGYADTPGIWSQEQAENWQLTTSAVHKAGGRIFMQLWHVGRISHPSFLNGALPVAPSAIAPAGNVSLLRPETPYVVPHALERDELLEIVEDFRRGAQNAQQAGFDGVELHGANGYLFDQFLQDSANKRTDEYGGSVENRARLMLDTVDALISVWGKGRVGVHLAPRGDANQMGDSDLGSTFTHVAKQLGARGIAFICAREHAGEGRIGPQLKAAFGGVYIANERFTRETAEQVIVAGEADAVAFGRLFIANPDLPARFKAAASLNRWDTEKFYSGGVQGYTDYPRLTESSRVG
ncbi:MAG: alkene reductase [Candidatus Obscuribacterales bacterium]|nr:alkene reductase [Steroidobacteraceae bacterium]